MCLCAYDSCSIEAAQPLDQMIDALGGQTFLDVDDIHTTGRFFSFSRGELSAGDLFADYIKFRTWSARSSARKTRASP
jgi:hypothetical protein